MTVACLLDEDEGELPQLTCFITKGIVYELSLLRKAYYNIIPWSQFYDWAKDSVVDQLQQHLLSK